MFYPNQLLIHSRKAELTAVWFAATLSRAVFKKRYKSSTINKLHVTKICEEIQEVACNRNEDGIKFSLYLLSQLMYGVTLLYSYQITYYEKDVFEIQKNLSTKERKEQNIDAIRNFDIDPFNVSLRKEISPQLDKNLHLSQYQNLNDGLQIMMTATVGQDFGALTDKEMDFMYESDTMMDKRLRIVRYSEGRDVTMIEDIEIIEEVHQERRSSRSISSPMLVSVYETNAKLPMTPQKREAWGQSQVDTPTKRRRVSFEEMVVPCIEAVTEEIRMPISQQVASISQQVAPISQQIESDVELQSLESFESVFAVKKSKNIIDKKTILNDKLCVKWRRSVNIWCKETEIARVRFTAAETLLTQPSHKRYAARLRPLFNNHFTFNRITRSSSTDENIVPTELIQLEEPLRAEESTRLNLPTELSGLGKTTMITADGSTVVHEASAMPPSEMTVPDIIAEGVTKDITKRKDHQKKVTDINEINETLEDITTLLEKQHLNNDFISESPARSSRTSQTIPLTSREILAMLETFWCDQEYIPFNDLIPDTYSAKDKITAFSLLLALHTQQKVVLKQEDCHGILYIYKYDTYSDSSSMME